MDETVIFPSPNWFQPSGFVVSSDGWLVYGGPSKSLCVLEPLPPDFNGVIQGNQGFKAHVVNRSHREKIVCVDVSPEWPTKRYIITGSVDGGVKQWSVENHEQSVQIKSTHTHDIHHSAKEEVVGVGYCNDGYAVTLGSHGHITKWDLNSNVVKNFGNLLKNFKPLCLACSPHLNLNVAVGTKQGVVFVFDLNGAARIVYKVRCQDEEIIKMGFCPQYEVAVTSIGKEPRKSVATQKMEKIRQEPETAEVMKELDERIKVYCDRESLHENEDPVNESHETSKKIKESLSIETKESQETPKTNEDMQTTTVKDELKHTAETSKQTAEDIELTKPKDPLDESGIGKTLPEDSFEDSVKEDDMFDIYEEPAIEEFGHKKYQPEDILVKIKEETKDQDYLAECLKLKDEILKRKNQPEQSIASLVEALDKTHVEGETDGGSSQNVETTADESQIVADQSQTGTDATPNESTPSQSQTDGHKNTKAKKTGEPNVRTHKHLLATIGKSGTVRILSHSGKLVSSCFVAGFLSKTQKNQRAGPNWTTLLWYKANTLLIADGKSQLVECNPLITDDKNRVEYQLVHSLHKRGLYAIASTAPRVQPPDAVASDWVVWTAAQDRYVISYSMQTRQTLSVRNSCGGFLYTVAPCPYDARKVAVSVGDGAVRVWETDTLGEEETSLSPGHVASYWQNVQGKVLTLAWHPTRENWLAFGTAESRVGLIDISSKTEKPAKVLLPALSGGVYALCWGQDNDLYACGGNEIVVYKTNKPENAPVPMRVELEGQRWEASALAWYPHGMACGSSKGAVAVLAADEPHHVIAATFVFSKMIHTIAWHPQETSSSSELSPYRNLIAVCSLDKVNTIIILEFGDKGVKQLSVWKTLVGHKNTVHQVSWNPHIDGQLLSTSQDGTVRVWDAVEGSCISIFAGHTQSALSAAWSAFPQLAGKVLSGGGDCCLRLWDVADHPPQAYTEIKESVVKRRKNKKEDKKKAEEDNEEDETAGTEEQAILKPDNKTKPPKKFLFPMIYRQMNECKVNGPRKMLQQYVEKNSIDKVIQEEAKEEYDLEYLKIFGTINEVNEVLDIELERHQDMGMVDSWSVLCVIRGHIDTLIQHASQRDQLDPFLLSVAPCVSFKYWKDVTQMYVAQIDRLLAKGEELKLTEGRSYGGGVYRKVVALLSIHDVKGAVDVLVQARLYKEAYVLCRIRYMDSIAEQTLKTWANASYVAGCVNLSAVCYIALGNLSQAAIVLGKSSSEDSLSLAADIAKVIGQTTFAGHIEEKRELLKSKNVQTEKPEELEELPSKVEALVKEDSKAKEEDDEKDGKTEELLPSKEDAFVKGDSSLTNEDLPSKEDAFMKGDSNVTNEDGKQGNKIEETLHSNGDIKANDGGIQQDDKTKELLEELHSKMEELMKEKQNVEEKEVGKE